MSKIIFIIPDVFASPLPDVKNYGRKLHAINWCTAIALLPRKGSMECSMLRTLSISCEYPGWVLGISEERSSSWIFFQRLLNIPPSNTPTQNFPGHPSITWCYWSGGLREQSIVSGTRGKHREREPVLVLKRLTVIRDTIRRRQELTSQNWLNHSERTVRRQSRDACQGLEWRIEFDQEERRKNTSLRPEDQRLEQNQRSIVNQMGSRLRPGSSSIPTVHQPQIHTSSPALW